MSGAIIRWLGARDTGISSKAIALTALGEMPEGAAHSHPHDGGDLGRCLRLIAAAPEAKAGLDKLAADGGPYWAALAARWDELSAAHAEDIAKPGKPGRTYDLMRSILDPIEKEDRRVVRLGSGVTMRWGS